MHWRLLLGGPCCSRAIATPPPNPPRPPSGPTPGTRKPPPFRKVEIVRDLQRRGDVVAMIGDGVNDAPSLAQADLGIALGSGADIAMMAAPLVLMGASLDGVIQTLDLARRTFRIVRQNLFWAFAYNVAGIALAAAGVLNPILAAAAMVLSSLSVIGNSRRLA
jgi:P-type E1-E2 ATPase